MKILKISILILLGLGLLYAAMYFIKTNSRSPISYDVETPFRATIEQKTVATGKVIPEDEVKIKPQITGIVDKIYVEEGNKVTAGQLLATVKVIPNEQSLNSANGRVKNAQIVLDNTKIEYERNKALFEKGVISNQDFNTLQLRYDQAKQDLSNAQNDLKIIREGTIGGGAANTNIRATIAGTILEIPVKEGDQVIQSNNFNDGTTIATIADMNKMIFEGKVDESEVGKLYMDMPLIITLGAIQKTEFDAKLKFVAPKGNEEQGAVQFTIKGDVYLDEKYFIRAGYSANASIILEKKDSVFAIKEALLQFDKETEKPFVEVEVGDQKYERRDVETGLSDGINVEIVSGLKEGDKIKVWNKTEPIKRNTEEDNN